MAQSILDVPLDRFRVQVSQIHPGNLRGLIMGIYDLKYTLRGSISDAQMLDLERKETIITGELQKRGILTKKNKSEFEAWRRRLFKKKNF